VLFDSLGAGFLEGESTARIEKRYLGSCSVPFTTLFHEGRIEGVFRMDTPTINFGEILLIHYLTV
jgi:hypothetical protein